LGRRFSQEAFDRVFSRSLPAILSFIFFPFMFLGPKPQRRLGDRVFAMRFSKKNVR